MKVNEFLKTILYLPHSVSLLKKANFKTDQSQFVCSNALTCLKKNIFELFSTQIFGMNVDESIKTIFYLTNYACQLK